MQRSAKLASSKCASSTSQLASSASEKQKLVKENMGHRLQGVRNSLLASVGDIQNGVGRSLPSAPEAMRSRASTFSTIEEVDAGVEIPWGSRDSGDLRGLQQSKEEATAALQAAENRASSMECTMITLQASLNAAQERVRCLQAELDASKSEVMTLEEKCKAAEERTARAEERAVKAELELDVMRRREIAMFSVHQQELESKDAIIENLSKKQFIRMMERFQTASDEGSEEESSSPMSSVTSAAFSRAMSMVSNTSRRASRRNSLVAAEIANRRASLTAESMAEQVASRLQKRRATLAAILAVEQAASTDAAQAKEEASTDAAQAGAAAPPARVKTRRATICLNQLERKVEEPESD